MRGPAATKLSIGTGVGTAVEVWVTVGVAVIVGVTTDVGSTVIVGVEVVVGPVAVGVGVAAIGASRTACAVKTGIELGKLAFAVNVGEASP